MKPALFALVTTLSTEPTALVPGVAGEGELEERPGAPRRGGPSCRITAVGNEADPQQLPECDGASGEIVRRSDKQEKKQEEKQKVPETEKATSKPTGGNGSK